MSNELNALAERVAALERTVALLQGHLAARPPGWLNRLTGSVSDPEAFDEAMRLGREFRRTGRVPDQPDVPDESP